MRSVIFGIVLLALGFLLFSAQAELRTLLFPQLQDPVEVVNLGLELPAAAPEQVREAKERKPAEQEVITPPPLRSEVQAQESVLTQDGVLAWTNSHRVRFGLSVLQENTLLNQAAARKLQDMFARQYFAHNAPDGTMGAGELAGQAGYGFLLVGENLALGTYEDDQALVQAWMDSPGHRANILNGKFQELGVAVGQGLYEGNRTWLAVQIFGRPLSACPAPHEALRLEIAERQGELEALWQVLEQEREELERAGPKFGPAYSRKVERYNELVAEYNALAQETRSRIELYNGQAAAFNACAAG